MFAIHFNHDMHVFASRASANATQAYTVTTQERQQTLCSLANIADHLLEASSKPIVHPDVYQRICYSVTHGQIMRNEPNVHDILMLPNIWVHVTNDNQCIKWQPC